VTGVSLTVPSFFLGNSLVLSGTFPTIPNAVIGNYWVTLERSFDGGQTWTAVALSTSTGGGYYNFAYTPTNTGSQEYRVFFTGIPESYVNGSEGPLQQGGLSVGGPALVESYDFPLTSTACVGLPSRGATCATNSTDIQYGTVDSLTVGTYSSVFASLASGINAALTSLGQSTQASIGTVNTNVGTLSSQLTALQASAAKASDLTALQGTVNNLNNTVNTLTDVAYAALAIAIILGLLAIFLSRRK